MKITEVRVKLVHNNCQKENKKLRAFAWITFDNLLVVSDLRIIEGAKSLFVAMPNRKIADHCLRCGNKNPLLNHYCGNCGCNLDEDRQNSDINSCKRFYADIVHPIDPNCRDMIHKAVLNEYFNERELAKQPGYVSKYCEWGEWK